MEVRLSPEGERFVRQAIARGLYSSADQTVEAALRLLELRERTSTTKEAVVLGLEQVLAGRSMTITSDDIVRRVLRAGGRR